MAYGLPVVSTHVGAAAETLGDGIAGLIVPPGDTQALADALQKLISGRELRLRMARSARARIEAQFSVEQVASRLAGFYKQALDMKRVRP
jgi:glycosyltransferase involved in cell wall biosynthesis